MEFLIIGAIGLAVLVVALLVGEVFDLHGLLDSDVFSIASLGAFTSAFGFGAAATQDVVASLQLALLVGTAMGVLFAWFTIWLTRKVRGLRSGSTVSTTSLVGHEALVLTTIPDGGYGQVVVRVAGHRVTYSAKSPIAVDAGSRVWVTGVLSPTAVEVRPTDALPDASTVGLPD